MAKTLAAAGLTLASLAATAVLFSPVASAETCKASYYDGGGTTASGERFDPNKLTAAHKTLPFGTRIRVTRPGGPSVVLRVNDRCGCPNGRIVDVSVAAAHKLDMLRAGVVQVRLEVVR